MADQAQAKKVLRIGIIQEGKIVQERLIKAGTSVLVGESAKNTFVFPKTHLPKAEFVLFQAKSGNYSLNFTAQMKGKVSSGGQVAQLNKLQNDSSVQKKGDVWTIPLTDQDRGKVVIDEITVLFQFVAPPPVQAVKPIQAMDFRPRLIEEDSPVFLGFLSVWSALALVFCIWIWSVEPAELTIDQLPRRVIAQIVKPPEAPQPQPTASPEPSADEKPAEKAPEKEADPKPASKAQASDREAAKSALKAGDKLLLKLLGTNGESGGAVVENLFNDQESGLGNLENRLANAGGVDATAGGLKQGQGGNGAGGDSLATVGEIGKTGGGDVKVGPGPAVTVEANVNMGDGDLEGATGDGNKVKSTVRKYMGQLKYCYEQRLKANPNLQGRIEISWSVEEGKVSNVAIAENNTGDGEFANCIVKKIKGWKFDEGEGDMSWPFIFAPKKG